MELFVERLTVIDSALLDGFHGLIGESWMCDCVLAGALDSQSMVMDFGVVKKRLKAAIDRLADHVLLVPERAPELVSCERGDERIALRWRDRQGREISYRAPAQAVCLLPAEVVTPEALARWLESALRPELAQTVERITLTLHAEKPEQPYYHYAHGLRKHDGNCQRMAHGHRSQLEITRDGAVDLELAAEWCADWQRRYIASRGDIQGRDMRDGIEYVHLAYDAPQGRFELEIPTERCILIEGDSTVESIATLIARTLKLRHPESSFRVKAYEGVGKGAVAEV